MYTEYVVNASDSKQIRRSKIRLTDRQVVDKSLRESIPSDTTNLYPKLKKQKTLKEISFQEFQFEKEPSWSRKTVQKCRIVLKISTDQIYKWGYSNMRIKHV